MADPLTDDVAPSEAPAGLSERLPDESTGDSAGLPWAAKYAAALLLVAMAAVIAFAVERLVAAPNLTLVFVLPVVIAATSFGWGPSMAAAVASVLAFDFFFTEPKFSFAIASASDVWAAVLLLVTAAIVSTVAAESRRRAIEARRAAEQAEALRSLAHVLIESRPQGEIVRAAATALGLIFRAPAAIFRVRDGALELVATARGARITRDEEEAARGALDTRVPMRSESYPFESSKFDFWPVATPRGPSYVLGVNFNDAAEGRPNTPERLVEVVGAYLAAASGDAR